MNFVVLHTTTDTEELARRIADAAVTQRLAACVQIVPIQSVYRWEGQVESASEFRCELKTSTDHSTALRTLIGELHTYDVPEIVEFLIHDASDDYRSWLTEQLPEN
jgi:periplasmic divalent cation tolerance protein